MYIVSLPCNHYLTSLRNKNYPLKQKLSHCTRVSTFTRFSKTYLLEIDCKILFVFFSSASVCDKRPIPGSEGMFEQQVNGAWMKMPCAPGTQYNPTACSCSMFGKKVETPHRHQGKICFTFNYLLINMA